MLFTLKPLLAVLATAFLLTTPTDASFASRCVASHNKWRAQHKAAPLKHSNHLAAVAQSYANKCIWGHSGNGLGENLAIGFITPEAGIRAWVAERSVYNYKKPGFSHATGHFTQVVWRGTTHVGCGWKKCPDGKLLVCNYNEPGNWAGQFPANVKPQS